MTAGFSPLIGKTALFRTLRQTLRAGGRVLKSARPGRQVVTLKGPVDPVTATDKASERRILRILSDRFPGHSVVTEESAGRKRVSPYRWIIDPLDGTVNFAHGIPHCAVSVGLEENGRMLMGGVYDPFREEMFLAVRNRGATLNGKRIRVSRTRRLLPALLATGFPYDRHRRARRYLSFVEKFLKVSRGIRRFGAAVLDMAYVACGRYDGFWEFNLHPWDVAAGWVLVEEAGGRVSDFRGRPFRLAETSQTLCSNGSLHRALVGVLKEAAP